METESGMGARPGITPGVSTPLASERQFALDWCGRRCHFGQRQQAAGADAEQAQARGQIDAFQTFPGGLADVGGVGNGVG